MSAIRIEQIANFIQACSIENFTQSCNQVFTACAWEYQKTPSPWLPRAHRTWPCQTPCRSCWTGWRGRPPCPTRFPSKEHFRLFKHVIPFVHSINFSMMWGVYNMLIFCFSSNSWTLPRKLLFCQILKGSAKRPKSPLSIGVSYSCCCVTTCCIISSSTSSLYIAIGELYCLLASFCFPTCAFSIFYPSPLWLTELTLYEDVPAVT